MQTVKQARIKANEQRHIQRQIDTQSATTTNKDKQKRKTHNHEILTIHSTTINLIRYYRTLTIKHKQLKQSNRSCRSYRSCRSHRWCHLCRGVKRAPLAAASAHHWRHERIEWSELTCCFVCVSFGPVSKGVCRALLTRMDSTRLTKIRRLQYFAFDGFVLWFDTLIVCVDIFMATGIKPVHHRGEQDREQDPYHL